MVCKADLMIMPHDRRLGLSRVCVKSEFLGPWSRQKSVQAIEAFQKDPPTTVFLLSMRSGSVGINLTSANHVFILEPALNPALEEQAVGRAWRMGQQREVIVKKFYIKVSIFAPCTTCLFLLYASGCSSGQ